MVMILFDQLPVTPSGRPLKVAPVAPVVVYVIVFIELLSHILWLSEPTPDVNDIEFIVTIEIVPVFVTIPHPPVSVIVKLYGEFVFVDGEPLIDIVLLFQMPVTPVGSPLNVAPVAPVVE